MDGIDLALQRVTDIIDLSYGRLLPHAQTLLFYVSVIEISLLFLLYAFGRQETIADLIKKMLVIGFFVWVIRDFQTILDTIFMSAAELGVIAGTTGTVTSAEIQRYLTPSSLIRHGAGVFGEMLRAIGDLPWGWGASEIAKGVVMAILFALLSVIVLIGFVVGGIRVLMTTIEFHLLTSLVLVMLPFAVLRPTAFIAERSFAIVVSLSVKMMVTLFVMTLVDSILVDMQPAGGTTLEWQDIVAQLVIGILVPILIWVAPNLAAGLMSGNPSLNAGQFVVSAAGMALAGTAVAAGAVAAPVAGGKAAIALGRMGAAARIASSSGAAGGSAGAGGAGTAPVPGGGGSPRGGSPSGGGPAGGNPGSGGRAGGGSPGATGVRGPGGLPGTAGGASSTSTPQTPSPAGGSAGASRPAVQPGSSTAATGNSRSTRGNAAPGNAGPGNAGPGNVASGGSAGSGAGHGSGTGGARIPQQQAAQGAPASGSSTSAGARPSSPAGGQGGRPAASGPAGTGRPTGGAAATSSDPGTGSRRSLSGQLMRRGYQAGAVRRTAASVSREVPHDTPTPKFRDDDA